MTDENTLRPDRAATDGARARRPYHLQHGAGFHHTNVWAASVDGTIRFYEQASVFELLLRWGGVDVESADGEVFFRDEREGAHLNMGDGNILELSPAPEGSEPPDLNHRGFNHIGVRVPDLEAAYERALANGAEHFPLEDERGRVWDGPATITLQAKPPFERSFRVRAAHVLGPNGEIIELFET